MKMRINCDFRASSYKIECSYTFWYAYNIVICFKYQKDNTTLAFFLCKIMKKYPSLFPSQCICLIDKELDLKI